MKKIFLSFLAILFLLPAGLVQAGWDVDELDQFNLPNSRVYYIAQGILLWLIEIVGIVSLISFIIAGILYLTAAGSETQAEKAKKAMTYSIIGVVVSLAGFVVLQAAEAMLGGQSF